MDVSKLTKKKEIFDPPGWDWDGMGRKTLQALILKAKLCGAHSPNDDHDHEHDHHDHDHDHDRGVGVGSDDDDDHYDDHDHDEHDHDHDGGVGGVCYDQCLCTTRVQSGPKFECP